MARPPLAHRIIITQPYTPALDTDIRKSFAAERKRLSEEKRRREANEAEAAAKTVPLQRKRSQP